MTKGNFNQINCLRLTMRLITALLFMACLSVSANTRSQQISISGKNISLEKVFAEIKRQTNLYFLYENSVLQQAKPVNIDVKNVSVEAVLVICFTNQPLVYKIIDKTVVIRLKDRTSHNEIMALDNTGEEAINVFGKVFNDKDEPIEGVTVTIKGTSQSTYTNSNGEFNFNNLDPNAVLQFSAVNMETFELRVNGQTNLIIKLKAKISALENVEVVVNTGYQELPKERATGSFYKIDNELLNRKISTTVIDRIFNVSSGLSYTQTTGGPLVTSNGLPGLQIRGASTINANKIPLIVVDNFPYQGDINNINPNDIENITLLKDAAAASIWGIQSGNGVIVITTKKGKFNQKTNVTINSNVTVGDKPDLFYIPTIPSADVIAFEKKRFGDSVFNIYDDVRAQQGILPPYSYVIEFLLAARKGKITWTQANEQIAALEKHDVRNDINKYLLQRNIVQQYSLNISGGSKEYKYFGSIGYDINRPVEVGNESRRLSLRMNSIWKPVKNLEITAEINYIQGINSSHGNNYTFFLPTGNGQPPYSRLADESGNALPIPQLYRMAYVDTAKYPALLDWHYRPLEELKYNNSSNKLSDVRFIAGAKYSILKAIDIGVLYQYQRALNNSTSISNPNSFTVRSGINTFMNIIQGDVAYPWPLGSMVTFNNSSFRVWNIRYHLSFNQTWGNHNISSVLGYEISESGIDNWGSSLIGYDEELSIVPVVDYLKLYPVRPGNSQRSIGARQTVVNLDNNLFRNGSYFANVGYTFKNKYLLTVSTRTDQANLFGVKANQRTVPLWSTGLGWIVSNESFYNIDWLTNLKFRFTYGFNGNASKTASALPTITYASLLGSGLPIPYYAFIRTPDNPQLRWEKVKMINLGIDFAMLNNRLNGSFEYYHKKGIDLLGQLPTDPTTGWTSYLTNFASIKSEGIDIVLNSKNINTEFLWNTSLNFSINTDRVIDYGGQSSLTASNLVNGFPVQIGQTLYALNSYRWAGLDPVNGTPRIYLADTISGFNNYTKGKSTDVVHQGSRSPRIFGNIINTLSWNNISISCNITYKLKYVFRRSSFDGKLLSGGPAGASPNGGHRDYLLRWQKPGDEAYTNVPAAGVDRRYEIYGFSDILTERGDHIRLQDVRVSYSLNKFKLNKVLFQSVELYFYANNLGIIWRANKLGIDPEAYFFGSVPTPKTFSFGVTVNY